MASAMKHITYRSTRGHDAHLSFDDILTSGLAPDGGLYMPSHMPHFDIDTIRNWEDYDYQELAFQILYPFIEDTVDAGTFRQVLTESYKHFRHKDITPIHSLSDQHHLLELFHGPTLAFKDVALQFLGQMLDYVLWRDDKDVVVMGATSGDTGSASIEGVFRSEHVKVFTLYPHDRVSEVQRRQMTTIDAPNVYNLAIGTPHGNFDDCQTMVKHMFQYPDFAKGTRLVAVNSINWTRILAQVVYYFYAALKLDGLDNPLSFSVPTGNFGDVFAGYIAKKMGLPIDRLIIATNTNDILHRFFTENDYSRKEAYATITPSMDIQISSNFERLLYDLHDQDAGKINALMDHFASTNKLEVSPEILEKARSHFSSVRVDEAQTKDTMREYYKTYDYILDPHSAIGAFAADSFLQEPGNEGARVVTLATAHAAKFPDVVKETTNIHPELPEHLSDLLERKESFTRVENNLEDVQAFIAKHL